MIVKNKINNIAAEITSEPATDIAALQRKIVKLEKIQSALMKQVERNMDTQHDSFSLFQTAILENQVQERTQDLQQQKLLAEEANKFKSTFLANMSHELRTPLNAILGYSDIAIEDLNNLGLHDIATDIGKVRQSGKHLLGLINDVLNLSKIESGRMGLFIEKVDIQELLNDVSETITPSLQKNNNTLCIKHTGSIKKTNLDITKTRQILLNLLSNATKFTTQDTIYLNVSQQKRENKDVLCFSIKDAGIGITQAQQEKLFQPFVQANKDTQVKYGGTGLGLTISRHFAEMMNGSLTVQSQPNKGSQFTCCLSLDL